MNCLLTLPRLLIAMRWMAFLRKQKNMITVKAQKNVKTAKTYFESHLEKRGYHQSAAPEMGTWVGLLAGEFNLAGDVDQQSFERLASGRHPLKDGRLTQRGRGNRVAYFDFVCSAPKSVSVVALVGGDERVKNAHRQAALEAFQFLERSACVRERSGSNVLTTKRTYTGKIVGAMFDHESSRENDCQLHRHCCVFNVTKGPDGKLKALDARRMYDHSQAATEVYRSELARSLLRMGYSIRNTPLGFEISGVEQNIIETFSSRSGQIGRLVASEENRLQRKLSNNEKAVIVHRSRKAKKEIPRSEFQKHLRGKITDDELSRIRTLVSDANGRRGQIVGNVSLPNMHRRRKRIDVFRDALMAGRGKVDARKLERRTLGTVVHQKGEMMVAGVGRGNGRLARALVQRGVSGRLEYLMRSLTRASVSFEKAIDAEIQIFR